MQTKQFATNVKAIDGERGIVTAIVSAFRRPADGVDGQGDRVLPGAFSASIENWGRKMALGQFLPVVYGHKDDPGMILGKVIALRQTDEGLEADEQFFLDKPAARDAFAAIKAGVLPKSSFAYEVIRAKSNREGGYDLAEVDLIEVGSTLYPADDRTRLVGAKATDPGAWDSNRAMTECSTAAQYGEICAAAHDVGQPDERQHWAGPHHYLGKGPNEAGVRAALSRWGTDLASSQVQNITEAEWSKGLRHLQSHMAEINPDYAPKTLDLAPLDPLADAEVARIFGDALVGAFTKAGRVISAKNESQLKQARDLIDGVLASVASAGEDTAAANGKADESIGTKADDPHPLKAASRDAMAAAFADADGG